MKKIYLTLLIVVTLLACESDKNVWKVENHGVLREIMQEQKIAANADLKDFENAPDLFALGALEGLSGEILILNSKPFNGMANQGTLVFDKSFDQKATLLVSSQVAEWEIITIKETFNNLKELQGLVLAQAEMAGIDVAQPFPFRIKGDFQRINWHVINAKEAEEQNHAAFKKAGLSGSGTYAEAEVLGFYSTQHEGIFTHHGSYLHLHFLSGDQFTMGHVDDIEQSGVIELYLPKTKK